ncbi:50S ribosome-binding protein YggL [Shewanella sp. NIFS-20-20]|uniref:50S ribosome-binding protein YggL n=1 Tax=Shewanella sp. NIFS-20-20 TaxID=2853806 RepID=UPI001C465AD8|nr:50S ribosome-binding protein YggL [Shewanella sp. NIFS-20-20]MBV7316796.1 YggL family protein [Shewanella sp. NIFS-20-20]
MKLDKIDNKSKRLRKKLYLGEFAVFGFQLQCQLSCQTEAEYDQFTDELFAFLEAHELCTVCGASNGRCDAIVLPEARYGAPQPAAIDALAAWLAAHPMVSAPELGQLQDLTYDEFEVI